MASWFGCAGLGLAAAALVAASAGAGPTGEDTVVRLGTSVELCIPADDPEVPDVLSGHRRPVLVAHAFQPGDQGGGGLRVVSSTGAQTRIGFFPAVAFSEQAGDEPMRYFLPVGDAATAGDLCYAVTLEGGGWVEVSLEISEPLRP